MRPVAAKTTGFNKQATSRSLAASSPQTSTYFPSGTTAANDSHAVGHTNDCRKLSDFPRFSFWRSPLREVKHPLVSRKSQQTTAFELTNTSINKQLAAHLGGKTPFFKSKATHSLWLIPLLKFDRHPFVRLADSLGCREGWSAGEPEWLVRSKLTNCWKPLFETV